MLRPESPTRPRPSDVPSDYQPRVVVKLRESAGAAAAGLSVSSPRLPAGRAPGGGQRPLEALAARFPGARAERLIQSVSPARLQSMTRDARRAEGGAQTPDLGTFYTVAVPRGTEPAAVIGFAEDLAGVETAYLQGAPTPPPVSPGNDPLSASQGYLDAAPKGIDARYAWTLAGGDGQGVGFVDLEQGWTLNHVDLAGAGISLISGQNQDWHGHGTAVLGEVVAQDNTTMFVGIAPLARARVVSQWQGGKYQTAAAILSAAAAMRSGDVLLLEAQTTIALAGGATSTFLPVEVDLDVYAAIRYAVAQGIIVVEAAGNGGNDLDAFQHPKRGFCLRPGHADFRDSGAILVGSCTSAVPHSRFTHPNGPSNFGGRIDCFGWGENIATTGDGQKGKGTSDKTTGFGGTSGASPMVAGAALALQGIVKARMRRTWLPGKMRAVLRNAAVNTRSASPSADRIGVMPNLKAIVAAESLGPRPSIPVPARDRGDFPLPVGDTRVAALIDAGHGGEVEEEEPAYAGACGPAAEKDINLGIARRVRAHFGAAAALTRDGDHALALGERARRAREAGAPVFVSIHSNTGRTDRPGPEVWVYGGPEGNAGAGSRVLAQRISGELSLLGAGPVPVRAGDLALLRPTLYGGGTAACLVEAGSLAHPGMAARLREPAAQDAIGAAVARGVAGYLSDGGGRYGATELLEAGTAVEAWRSRDDDGAPAQACFHELAEAEQANWWDTPNAAMALADTAPAALQPLLRHHGVTYATFAPHEGRFYAALTEHMRRAGVLAAGAPALDQNTLDACVREFQRRRSLAVNGLVDGDTLWALQRDWAIGRRLGVRRVDADRVAGSGGYDHFRLRSDIVERYNALRAAVLAAGGVITSAGSMRELSAQVTAGRSTTSIHYTGLALDLATDTGMRSVARDRYLVTQDGRKWRVWCRSESAPEQTLDAVLWANGATRTQRVTARAFDFTALAERHGFARIGPRSTFPANYLSAEWWHFQCEAVLTPFVSQFGIELLSLGTYTEQALQGHAGIWRNRRRIFKSMRDGGWH